TTQQQPLPPPLQLFVVGASGGSDAASLQLQQRHQQQQHLQFTWQQDFGSGIVYSLTELLPIPLPCGIAVDDLVPVLSNRHQLPEFTRPQLRQSLTEFVVKSTANYFDKICEQRRAAVGAVGLGGAADLNNCAEQLCREFRLVKTYSTLVQTAGVQADHDEPDCGDSASVLSSSLASNSSPSHNTANSFDSVSGCGGSAGSDVERSEFRRAYLQLVNCAPSKAAKLVKIERAMAKQVEDLLSSAGRAMRELSAKQQAVMEEAVAQSGHRYTDEDINRLNAQHVSNLTGEAQRWRNELVMLKDRQKAAHRQLVLCQLNSLAALDSRLLPAAEPVANPSGPDAGAESSTPADGDAKLSELSGEAGINDTEDSNESYRNPIAWEESFTISVGTQLKTQHNLRLLSADLRRLLSPNSAADRLQTALSLYSDSLSAFVLLSSRDQACNPHVSASLKFSDLCERSADFHFDDYGRQMESIWRRINEANPAASSGGSNSATAIGKPSVGDVFITRHSNLNGAQLVFHLITESGDCPELTSQHPVIAQGLRRIVRTALVHDVNCLTLPLLLTTQLTEEMTITWCQRRAELVLKTIKGFLVEYITWQSHRTPRCFQFLLPAGLSESMLHSFSSCIQSIFSLSHVALMK
ncbi:hypothetical protein BOX15_Mlig000373g3, partial [Macrostomum lignano]